MSYRPSDTRPRAPSPQVLFLRPTIQLLLAKGCAGELQRARSVEHLRSELEARYEMIGASAPMQKLYGEIDKVVGQNQGEKMAAFVVVLSDDPAQHDGALKALASKQGLKNTPLTTYEDAMGPPSYKISKAADYTVMMWVDGQLKVNDTDGNPIDITLGFRVVGGTHTSGYTTLTPGGAFPREGAFGVSGVP